MHAHRFRQHLDNYRLPRLAEPRLSLDHFYLFPLACLPPLTVQQQMLYQLAFEQAQAVAQPSLPERDLLGVWN